MILIGYFRNEKCSSKCLTSSFFNQTIFYSPVLKPLLWGVIFLRGYCTVLSVPDAEWPTSSRHHGQLNFDSSLPFASWPLLAFFLKSFLRIVSAISFRWTLLWVTFFQIDQGRNNEQRQVRWLVGAAAAVNDEHLNSFIVLLASSRQSIKVMHILSTFYHIWLFTFWRIML